MARLAFYSLSIFLMTCHLSAQNIIPRTTVDTIIVVNTNVSGGGFQSDVTITDDGLTVYSSADVSGIFKSTDGGLHYKNINEGLKSPKVASLAITPDNDQIIYAGTGDKGGSGGLFRSIDGGDTWTLTMAGDSAQFAGNHSEVTDSLPNGHPRSNGDLIVVVEGPDSQKYTDDIVITGTYNKGVILFAEGGNIEASAVDSGHVRSVAYHPSIANIAYAAVQFSDTLLNGIYEIDFSDVYDTKFSLVYETLRPEGLTVLSNGHVYAAIGERGVVKYNGTSWNLKNNGFKLIDSLRQWTAVTAYYTGSKDIVYVGLNNRGGNENGTIYPSVWRTTNGGNAWDALVDTTGGTINNVSDLIYGQNYPWWYSTKAFPPAGLGRTNSVVSSIDVALGSFPQFVFDDTIYVSGRGGIWKSDNGGDLWQPAVYNMQATANNGVAVNPNNTTQVSLANTDYVVLTSNNRFEGNDIIRDKPEGSDSRAYDLIFDTKSNELIIGTGDRDQNRGGAVFVKADTAVGIPDSLWTDTDLQLETPSPHGRVRAVCYGYHNGVSETDQTILAYVEGEGVYRYYNGTWDKSLGLGPDIGLTKRSNFIWPDNTNSGVVYLLDLSEGLYRSEDGGVNWVDIWPSMEFNNKDFFNAGYLTADDNNPSIIYLSIQGCKNSPIGTQFKVYRLTDADTKIYGEPGTDGITDISKHSGNLVIKHPGPIVFGPDGNLWLTQQQHSPNSTKAALFVMENPTEDLSFKDVTTNEYRNIAIKPSGIDVSSDGHVYISQNGTGLVKIRYIGPSHIGLSNSCIEVYPDPLSNLFTISGDLMTYTIDIIDETGAIVSSLNNNGIAASFDTSTLPAGTFFVRLSDPSNNQLYLEQIIKF